MHSDHIEIGKSTCTRYIYVKPDLLKQHSIGAETTNLLCNFGIPFELLEFTFWPLEEDSLFTINQSYNLESPRFDKYLEIGSVDIGLDDCAPPLPVTLEIETDELSFFYPENYFEQGFINSSLSKFALSSIRVKEFEKGLKKLRADSEFETEFTDEQFDL